MVGARVRGGGGDGGLGIVVRGLQLVQTLLHLSCEIFIAHYCQLSLIGSCKGANQEHFRQINHLDQNKFGADRDRDDQGETEKWKPAKKLDFWETQSASNAK